jgi:hypothetical protein
MDPILFSLYKSKMNSIITNTKVKKKIKKIKKKQSGSVKDYENRPCINLSIIPIADENINKFNRVIQSPADCVINSLQILGVITSLSANIMRISSAGKYGFTKNEIEKIFILITGYNNEFKATHSSQDFFEYIESIPPGNAVFCGYEGNAWHVYLIGRTINGSILYIDPQLGVICNLNSEQCKRYITNNNLFRLMFRSTDRMTLDQLRSIGFSV